MNPLRFALALGALWLSACGGGDRRAVEERKEAPASSLPPAEPVADPASITGKVVFSGEKPVIRTISMDATPSCARIHKEPPKSEEVVVNENGTLRWTFVWVKAGLPERAWPAAQGAVTIDQVGCIYKPHVAAVRTGQDVEFLNSDPTNHNIHPMPRLNREWNESQPPQSDKKIKQFSKPEVMIPVKCNVHPWMKLWIAVVNHPFYAVTGEDGSFTLKGLPPGEYTIEAWHEKYGAQEMKVKVGPKEEKQVDFTFKG
jgi:plastocyanin